MLLCSSSWKISASEEIIDIGIHIICSEVIEEINENIAAIVKQLLQEMLMDSHYKPDKLFSTIAKQTNKKLALDIFSEACSNVPVQRCSAFFYEKAIPLLFQSTDAEMRCVVADFLLMCLPKYDLNLLNSGHAEMFRQNTKNVYIDILFKLLESQDCNWKKIWMFIVKCHGKNLLVCSDLTNSLLKVVEKAFRSKNTQFSIDAYDCWKELINVYSLNLQLMCTPKYMKLLQLPLRSASMRYPQLTKKRMEVWIYLIDVLGERAVDTCLRQFFEFCFGPLRENPLLSKGLSEPRTNRDIWQESTQALIEILGHDNHNPSECFNKFDRLLRLETPLITTTNFVNLRYIIINSVGECCSLMVAELKENNEICNKAVRCLWASIFMLISKSEKTVQENAIRRVTVLLAVFVEMSVEKEVYFDFIIKQVLRLLLSRNLFSIEVTTFNSQLLFPLLKTLLKKSDAMFLSDLDTIKNLMKLSKNIHNKHLWLEEVFEIFVKTEPKKLNMKGLLTLWVECCDMLVNICINPTGQTEKFVQNFGVGFMIWPVVNLHHLPYKMDIVVKFIDCWGNSFAAIYKTYTNKALMILNDLKNNVEDLPFIAPNVGLILPALNSMAVNDSKHGFVIALLSLSSSLLSIPSITKDNKDILITTVSLIMECLNEEKETVKFGNFQLLSTCFEHLLLIHKEYRVLQHMEKFFKAAPKSFLQNVPPSLTKALNTLKTNTDLTAKIETLFKYFIVSVDKESNKQLFSSPMQNSRAAKITNMVMATPTSSKSEETILRLFGHKIEVSSTGIRGSYINSAKQHERKTGNTFSEFKKTTLVDDDETTRYVEITEEPYQFDLKKLTEHQLEVLKKRRSDIPALYQDLTQTQCSLDSSNSVPINNLLENQYILNNKKSRDTQQVKEADVFKASINSRIKEVLSSINNEKTSEDLFKSEDVLANISPVTTNNKIENKSEATPKPLQECIYKNIDQELKGKPSQDDDFDLGNLKIKNPSMKQIHTLITGDDSHSKEKKIKKNKDKDNFKEILKTDKKQQRVIKELNKIKMDIVGGDSFVKDLDLTSKIKTRRSADKEKLLNKPRAANNTSQTINLIQNKTVCKPRLRATVQIVGSDGTSSSSVGQKQQKSIEKRTTAALTNDALSEQLNKEGFAFTTEEEAKQEKQEQNLKQNLCMQVPSILNTDIDHNIDKIASGENKIQKSNYNKSYISDTKFEINNENDLHSYATLPLENCSSSEDVIESSQESAVDIILFQEHNNCNGTNKNCSRENTISQNLQNNVIPESNSEEIKNKVAMALVSSDNLMEIDLAAHINKNEKNTSEMDTETLDLLVAPTKAVSIPTSPIASDTPTKTKELLSSTLDISPIKSGLKKDSDICDKKEENLIPNCNSPTIAANSTTLSKLIDVTPTSEILKSIEFVEENSLYKIKNCSLPSRDNPKSDIKSRSLKLLSMVTDTSPEKDDKTEELEESKYSYGIISNGRCLKLVGDASIIDGSKMQQLKLESKNHISSPKTNRIMKMMQSFEKVDSDCTFDVEMLEEEQKEIDVIENVLKFVRDLPSPMASPRYSILKRRAPDSRDEGLSPPRKKRVNFSDPPTTCKKVFFKDKNEYSKYLDTVETIIIDDIEPSSEKRISPTENSTLECRETVESSTELIVRPRILNFDETDNNNTESVDTTQGSIDDVNPLSLQKTEPIVPELVNCKESIEFLIPKLTTPVFESVLKTELSNKNIHTVGDLAKLNELEISRLTFKSPKLLMVHTTLKKFLMEKADTSLMQSDNQHCKNHENNSISNEPLNNEESHNNSDNTTSITVMKDVLLSSSSKICKSLDIKSFKSPRRIPLIKVNDREPVLLLECKGFSSEIGFENFVTKTDCINNKKQEAVIETSNDILDNSNEKGTKESSKTNETVTGIQTSDSEILLSSQEYKSQSQLITSFLDKMSDIEAYDWCVNYISRRFIVKKV